MNNNLRHTNLFINKYVTAFCFMPRPKNEVTESDQKEEDSGRVGPSFVYELDGRFFKKGMESFDESASLPRRLINMYDESLDSSNVLEKLKKGNMLAYISKLTLLNLVK